MDRCQRADYSIERRGYERDEPRFELIFRKWKTRSSTPSSYVYPVIPAGHCFRFDSTDEGGGAIEKAVRTSMVAARDSGSTRGNPRPSNRSAKKSGRRQTTADPHLPRSLPQIEIRFSSLDFPSSSPPGTGHLTVGVGRGSKRVRFSRGRFKILSLFLK